MAYAGMRAPEDENELDGQDLFGVLPPFLAALARELNGPELDAFLRHHGGMLTNGNGRTGGTCVDEH